MSQVFKGLRRRCGCVSAALRVRRALSRAILVAGLASLGPVSGIHGQATSIRLAGKEVFLASPRPGVRLVANTFYVRPTGLDMISRHAEQTRSDKLDVVFQRFSSDDGRTWSAPERLDTLRQTAEGTYRRGFHPGFADPVTGILLTMILQGTLPTDDPLEGMKHWTLWYGLSRDGGRSLYHEAPVVQQGAEYNPAHPLAGVWVGRNSAMIGDTTCVPIRLRSGEILQPIQITPVGPDGEYYNPGGGYTYHEAAVLIGKWNAAGTLDWDLSARVKANPAESTRGALEPTIAEAPDGRVLMVLRGSNDRKPDLPGYRWRSISTDGGRTWSPPMPWTYTDGERFFSPSSCSQLLAHTSGRIYWIGNISPANPKGNQPRYPLVIGEVDAESLLLHRETLCVIDDRAPGEPAWTAVSNFYAHEDRVTRQIVVHCSPLGKSAAASTQAATTPGSRPFDWTADAYIYRIAVPR